MNAALTQYSVVGTTKRSVIFLPSTQWTQENAECVFYIIRLAHRLSTGSYQVVKCTPASASHSASLPAVAFNAPLFGAAQSDLLHGRASEGDKVGPCEWNSSCKKRSKTAPRIELLLNRTLHGTRQYPSAGHGTPQLTSFSSCLVTELERVRKV